MKKSQNGLLEKGNCERLYASSQFNLTRVVRFVNRSSVGVIVIVMLWGIFIFSLGSCSHDENNTAKFSDVHDHRPITPRINTDRKYTCGGLCDENEHPFPEAEDDCAWMLFDSDAKTFECPCEDCFMVITNSYGQFTTASHTFTDLNIEQGYYDAFIDYLMDTFQTADVAIASVSLYYESDFEFLAIEYYAPVSLELQSVLYVDHPNMAGVPPDIEIDCSGGCDAETETCGERFILSTGDAECTCEGTCKLNVKFL